MKTWIWGLPLFFAFLLVLPCASANLTVSPAQIDLLLFGGESVKQEFVVSNDFEGAANVYLDANVSNYSGDLNGFSFSLDINSFVLDSGASKKVVGLFEVAPNVLPEAYVVKLELIGTANVSDPVNNGNSGNVGNIGYGFLPAKSKSFEPEPDVVPDGDEAEEIADEKTANEEAEEGETPEPVLPVQLAPSAFFGLMPLQAGGIGAFFILAWGAIVSLYFFKKRKK